MFISIKRNIDLTDLFLSLKKIPVVIYMTPKGLLHICVNFKKTFHASYCLQWTCFILTALFVGTSAGRNRADMGQPHECVRVLVLRGSERLIVSLLESVRIISHKVINTPGSVVSAVQLEQNQ